MRFFLFLFICVSPLLAQDFNARVVVEASRINQSNNQIFKNLETQLSSFMNETAFSGQIVAKEKRIPISLFLNISSFENNNFEASLQVQSARIIYNSSYNAPLVLIKDPLVNFQFQEFAPLLLNDNNVESNLVAVFTYYAYLILALDADSFSFNSGSNYYEKAQNVVGMAQARSFNGWVLNNSGFNRALLLNLLNSSESLLFKKGLYEYHINGLDKMTLDPLLAKTNISKAIGFLYSFGNNGTHRTLIQSFFDAKASEIHDIFTAGPNLPSSVLVKQLQTLSPLFGNFWSDIK